MKGTKFYYRLMAKGQKTHLMIAGQLISATKLFGKPHIESIYYSKEKYVFATELSVAMNEMYNQLGTKWSGYRLSSVDHVKNPANIVTK